MNLPLILAGPILRRVEPGLVSVWMALSEEATVKLTLWEGQATADQPSLLSGPATAAPTLRVGEKLHIVVVALKIPAESNKTLLPGRVYSYDVTLQTKSGKTENLKSQKLLQDGVINGQPHLALGYDPDVLPSFSLPPAELTDLHIVHGSCRRANSPQPDAQVWVDDLIKEARRDLSTYALKRPHQLLLTGDQIYADDVARLQLDMLIDLGKALLGAAGDSPIELLTVEKIREGANEPQNVRTSFPADQANFPPGRRAGLILDEARMTSTDGESHLLSFGEFCAMYLSVWSNVCWPLAGAFPKKERFIPPLTITPPPKWPSYLTDPFLKDNGKQMNEGERKALQAKRDRGYEEEKKVLTAFLDGLPKVRRGLANVPTYMMFDDHEVTDDWYLNPIWRNRVLTTVLGKTIIRNALLSYALFQGWGNDPVKFENDPAKFESGDYKRLLELATQLFPDTTPGPKETAGDEIDKLLGLDLASGQASSDPPIKWHYSVPGQKHHLLAIDNRTRRSFVSPVGPPGNVSITAQKEQIPSEPLPAGVEVLVVIAPLQVIGPPTFDELIAPAAYRVFDLTSHTELQAHAGTKGMTGTNPDAIEAWAFDPVTFEELLKRLEEKTRPNRRIVLLSGDVHYGTSSAMSYWRKGDSEPARFAQFTSSGIKNVMPWYIRFIDRSLGFAQRLARANIGAERLGWDEESPAPLQIPPGAELVPSLRSRLKQTPVLIPSLSLPPGTTLNRDHPPDWSWRVEVGFDVRPDAERPVPAQPEALGSDDVTHNLDGYRAVAKRHAGQLDKLNNSRQVLFQYSNIGVITFRKRVETINAKREEITDVVQMLYTSHPKAADPARAEPYTVHVIPLRAPAEVKPEDKLKPAG
jgi:hypothetical protein